MRFKSSNNSSPLTDEEVLAQIEDEIEPEECICVDEEITNIREQLEEIKDMLKQLLKKKK